jgi:hypothetical protein
MVQYIERRGVRVQARRDGGSSGGGDMGISEK